jgi:hypothetical protein
MRSKAHWFATLVVGSAILVVGCKRSPAQPSDAGAPEPASSVHVIEGGLFPAVRIIEDSGPPASGIPVPASKVEAAINPQHLPPYAGPTGVVEGVVTITGDPAPKRDIEIPFACGEAYATYGKAFREGTATEPKAPGAAKGSPRPLADVLLAVTGYTGFVPAKGDIGTVKIHGCAFDSRTVVVTYGQHLEVFNTDVKESFLPLLDGASMPAQIAAMPRGDSVKLYPTEVGHYALRDDAGHKWMYADVFVLRYPTYAVTGLDGHFRITGIPVGKVKVSMYAPVIDAGLHPDVGIRGATEEREIEVKTDEPVRADFNIEYKVPKPVPKPKVDPNRPIIK